MIATDVIPTTDAIDYTVDTGPRLCDFNDTVAGIKTIGRWRSNRYRRGPEAPWIEIRFRGIPRPSRYIAFESYGQAEPLLRREGTIVSPAHGVGITSKYKTGTTWWLLPEHRIFGDGLARHGFDIG